MEEVDIFSYETTVSSLLVITTFGEKVSIFFCEDSSFGARISTELSVSLLIISEAVKF